MEVKFGYGQLHRADVSSRQASKLLPEDCGWIIETEDTPVRFVCVDTTSPNENLQYLLTRPVRSIWLGPYIVVFSIEIASTSSSRLEQTYTIGVLSITELDDS